MEPTREEKQRYGADVRVLERDGDHTVYSFAGTGENVILTAYPVFPGIELVYHDIHASAMPACPCPNSAVAEIRHCREGRAEYTRGENSYFLAPGDLALLRRDGGWGETVFPTGHYHGVTVTLDQVCAPACLSCILQDVDVNIPELIEKLCGRSAWFSARSSARIEHVFSELYQVPDAVRKGYFKVKVLELLLFLSTLPAPEEQQSYSRSQVRLAGQVSDYLLHNTDGRLTVPELARRFGVSASLLNLSFRGVYGMSPAAWIRAQKMHAAAELLRSTDRTVLDIAGQFGYDNASKFAKAFRDIIGVSPNSYRAGIDRDSCAPDTAGE